MIDHKSGNSDWEGGGCNTTHLFRRISAFPLIRRQLRTLNSVEIVFFTSWPCRMALSVASFLISRMAESVQPPRFSTANGRNVIPAARTASPTWFSFLRWACMIWCWHCWCLKYQDQISNLPVLHNVHVLFRKVSILQNSSNGIRRKVYESFFENLSYGFLEYM